MKQYNIILIILLIMASMPIIPINVKALNYFMDTDLANADASFIGEDAGDWAGSSVAGAGDVNGDGYDDILIGAEGDENGGSLAGQTYLIFGNATDWAMDIDLANADASFIGENTWDHSGVSVAGAGDVNGDGYDDILIGAYRNGDGGDRAGQTYLILGNATGLAMDTDLANVDASFIGENTWDHSGVSVAGAGDVNGDGYDDILIGAYGDDDGGSAAGQTYLILGNATGWAMDTNLATADASFIGEDASDYSGYSVAGAGDVNSDGYDDILIGAYRDEDGGDHAGQTYLILGNASGLAMDTNLSNADASFIGEDASDESGRSVAGAGDVNGDGYDDILIGAYGDDDGGNQAGQTYLILGKESGWAMNTDLANADASFIGEDLGDSSGMSVAGASDVNGDGYDDILIGANGDDDGGNAAGQTYLILGKASGWAMDIDLSNVDASFIGEDAWDRSGCSVAGAGDVNGDDYDDILIGANYDWDGGTQAGQTYLIFPDYRFKPSSIYSVKAYFDDTILIEISMARMNDMIFIELQGTDGNASRKDFTYVNVRSDESSPKGFKFKLNESGLNTGKYRGNFTIKDRTHDVNHWIKASNGEIITVQSIQNTSKKATIFVGELVLYPLIDDLTAQEDESQNAHYSTIDIPNINWTFKTNALWLEWNETSHNISGTPVNSDVGSYWVRINVSSDPDFSDGHNFTLMVNNTPPDITTENILTIVQNQEYFVDYNSSDDNQGVITWHLATNASWLLINATSGNLTGTPANTDAGTCWINVSVDDGNDGWDSANFTLTVLNINDDPEIITQDVLFANLYELYKIDYNAKDFDSPLSKQTWTLSTNATWLTLDSVTGELYGIPSFIDVGWYNVNVSVKDNDGGFDWHEFILTVIESNSPPKLVEPFTIYEMFEDRPVILERKLLSMFSDPDSDTLTFTASEQDNLEVVIIQDIGTINLIPAENWFGTEEITFYANDSYSPVASETVLVTVHPTNDLPIIFQVGDKNIMNSDPELPFNFTTQEDDWLNLTILATDADGDVKRDSFEYSWDLTYQSNFYLIDNEIIFHPADEDVGVHYINLKVTDNNETPPVYVSQEILIEVRNINDLPSVTIITPESKKEFLESDDIIFICEAVDNDLLEPNTKERLKFEWYTNQPELGMLGSEAQIIVSNGTLPPGYYSITVMVEDGHGKKAFDLVEIVIKEDPKKGRTDGGKGFEIDDYLLLWALIVVIIIIVLSLLFLFLTKRKKQRLESLGITGEQGPALQPDGLYRPSPSISTIQSREFSQPQVLDDRSLSATSATGSIIQPSTGITTLSTLTPQPTAQLPPGQIQTAGENAGQSVQENLGLLEERLLSGELSEETDLTLTTKHEIDSKPYLPTPQLLPPAISTKAEPIPQVETTPETVVLPTEVPSIHESPEPQSNAELLPDAYVQQQVQPQDSTMTTQQPSDATQEQSTPIITHEQPQAIEPKPQLQTTPCPLCQKHIQKYTKSCPHCGGVLG